MRIKATIVAYAFSVQRFENTTIVAYAGLRVKCYNCSYMSITQIRLATAFCVVYVVNNLFTSLAYSCQHNSIHQYVHH